MRKLRICQTCDKEFEQTFGGRPRKNCYVCAPARVRSQPTGGQSDDAPVKHGNRGEPSVQSASACVHCGFCGAFTTGANYCNGTHERLDLNTLPAMTPNRSRMRPLERVRRMRAEQLENHTAVQKQRARERARQAA